MTQWTWAPGDPSPREAVSSPLMVALLELPSPQALTPDTSILAADSIFYLICQDNPLIKCSLALPCARQTELRQSSMEGSLVRSCPNFAQHLPPQVSKKWLFLHLKVKAPTLPRAAVLLLPGPHTLGYPTISWFPSLQACCQQKLIATKLMSTIVSNLGCRKRRNFSQMNSVQSWETQPPVEMESALH